MYHYDTDVGTFWIHLRLPDTFELRVGTHRLGSYHSPVDAAQDVAQCNTGYEPWDKRRVTDKPMTLSEWNAGAPYVEFDETEEEENFHFRK